MQGWVGAALARVEGWSIEKSFEMTLSLPNFARLPVSVFLLLQPIVLYLRWRRAVDCGLIVIRPWWQQHVVHRLETEPSRLLDHVHGTVYLSSSLTARHLSPSRNISRLIYLVYRFRARYDCVKRPCSSVSCLRRYNILKLLYITLTLEQCSLLLYVDIVYIAV